MLRNKPLIYKNNGKLVALCNYCFRILCEASCENDDVDGECVVINKMMLGDEETITTPLGKPVPPYCDKCDKLFNINLNE